MTTQTTKITDPIDISYTDSEARVALELAQIIAQEEPSVNQKNREYWLKLYYQCRQATSSKWSLEDILKAESHTGAKHLRGSKDER
jgi:hypothetical protein